jgi:hypothetical protein
MRIEYFLASIQFLAGLRTGLYDCTKAISREGDLKNGWNLLGSWLSCLDTILTYKREITVLFPYFSGECKRGGHTAGYQVVLYAVQLDAFHLDELHSLSPIRPGRSC